MPFNKVTQARIRALSTPQRENIAAQASAEPSFASTKDNIPNVASTTGAPNNPVSSKVAASSNSSTPSTQTLLIVGALVLAGWLIVRNQ